MRLLPATYDQCDEARELVSCSLDHELPELDGARLESHLTSCPACRAFAAQSSTVTHTLRASALEQPRFRVVLPRSRRVPVRLLQSGAAAVAVAVVAILGVSPGVWNQTGAAPSLNVSSGGYADRGDELVPNRHPTPQKPVGSERIAL